MSRKSKQLVLIAGARQEGIKEFFYQFASGLGEDAEKYESLRGWRWPKLRQEDFELLRRESNAGTIVSEHNIFELLFRNKNDSVVQQVLMKAIRDGWNNSTNGLILGEERFGSIGENPFTSDDALKTIHRLIENLSIEAKDVTIVLLYDTPRIKQWASVWNENSAYKEYSDFICQDNEADKRFEYTDTTMNPFKLATVYKEHGWNVAIVDEDGVRRSGSDPAHAIACNILQADCEKGWIADLKEKTSAPLPSYEINELEEDEKHELEELFLLRDCLYKQDLERGANGFQIVNRFSIWKNCRSHYDFELQEKIRDIDFFLEALRSQRDCDSDLVDLSEILAFARTTSIDAFLLPIILVSIFIVLSLLGILIMQKKYGTKCRNDFYGSFRERIFRRRKSTNHMPPDVVSQQPKPLCNACKFVRFDPNCIFCRDGKRLRTSEIGKEVERRIKEQQTWSRGGAINGTIYDRDAGPHVPGTPTSHSLENSEVCNGQKSGLIKASSFVSSTTMDLNNMWSHKNPNPRNIDTSHFDLNLRKTRNQSKKKGKTKENGKQKSKVVSKLKELLVLKAEESGENFYPATSPTNFACGENLQTITFEEDNDIYV